MSIAPFLSQESFDPDELRAMATAFDTACRSLGLREANDPLMKLVADKIIQNAQAGERDAVRLYEAVMTWAGAA